MFINICNCVLQNAAKEYSSEAVCTRLCGFLHDNSKFSRSRNMKFECVVVYENNPDMFDFGHYRTVSRSWHDFEFFLHLPQYKL